MSKEHLTSHVDSFTHSMVLALERTALWDSFWLTCWTSYLKCTHFINLHLTHWSSYYITNYSSSKVICYITCYFTLVTQPPAQKSKVPLTTPKPLCYIFSHIYSTNVNQATLYSVLYHEDHNTLYSNFIIAHMKSFTLKRLALKMQNKTNKEMIPYWSQQSFMGWECSKRRSSIQPPAAHRATETNRRTAGTLVFVSQKIRLSESVLFLLFKWQGG